MLVHADGFDANEYGVWSTDNSGNCISSTPIMSGTSTTLESYDAIFGQDLSGDAVPDSTSGPATESAAASSSVAPVLDGPGIEAVPLGHQAASRSYQLHHLEHRDPADRLLIATAIELACPLVTYDERIVRFGKKHGRQYRFAVDA